MGVAWSGFLDRHIAAPSAHTHRARDAQNGSAAVLPQPREVGPAAFASRGSFFRWLRVSLARSQRMSFRALADTPSLRQPASARMLFASLSLSDGAGGDALTVARRRRGLDALARTTRAVRADLSTAGRSRSQGELRDP